MAQCPNCSAEVPAGSKFCSECGAPQELAQQARPDPQPLTQKKRRFPKWLTIAVAIVAVAVVGWCIATLIGGSSPTSQATATARALARAVEAPSTSTAIPSSIETTLPQATPTPADRTSSSTFTRTHTPTLTTTNTSTPTSTPAQGVATTGVNLRAGPGTEYDQVGLLAVNDVVEVYCRTNDGEWYQVKAPSGDLVWVAAAYISTGAGLEAIPIITPTSTPTVPPPTDTPTVTPTPLPAVATCGEVIRARDNLTDAQWDAYKEEIQGKWIVQWKGRVTEVGDKGLLTGGYPLHIEVLHNCDLYYVIRDEDVALGFSKGQEIILTAQIDYLSQFLGSITLYLERDSATFYEGALGMTDTTPTPIALSYREFFRHFHDMTDMQQEAYRAEVVGTLVHWVARVEEVQERGRVQLEGVDDYPYIWVYLDGVPAEVALNLTKGQSIEFEAVVRETGTGLLGVGFAVYLDNQVLISPG